MDRIATKTLAEIYIEQGHLKEAYEIYKLLHQKNPHDNEILIKLNELEKKLANSSPSAQPHYRSKKEIIDLLTKWLENIEKRKRTHGTKNL
jgi:hypothetical protein